MCVVEGARDVAQDGNRIANWKCAAREPRPKRFALYKGHREVRQSIGFAGGEQRNYMGVLKFCGECDFSAKSFRAHAGRELGGENLDDNGAAQGRFFCNEHPRHTAGGQLTLKRV